MPVRGRTVKPRAVRVGRLWRIPREAWEEFLAALNDGPVWTAEKEIEGRRLQEEACRRLDRELGTGGKGRPKKETA